MCNTWKKHPQSNNIYSEDCTTNILKRVIPNGINSVFFPTKSSVNKCGPK